MSLFNIIGQKEFECHPNCGQCCDGLLNMVDGKEFGFYLTPDEVKSFPLGTVFPLFRRNGGEPFAYQIGLNRCPNLVDTGERKFCGVYDSRPLICRAFPATASDVGPSVQFDKCPYAIKEVSYRKCFEAVQEQIEQAKNSPQATEMFILNGKEWIVL